MKKSLRGKLTKAAAIVVVAAACGATCVSLSGCAKTQSYVGEMHYNQWAEYGIKVSVEVQTDKKGDRIRKVSVLDSDYVEASDAMNGWDPKVWNDNRQTLLNAYRGLYVADVLALEVVTDSVGAPVGKTDENFSDFGSNLIITDSTVGSGRLLIAVQNALSQADGYKVVEGEYGYPNPWGGQGYGAKVRVVLKDNVIKKVVTLKSEYTNATPSWDTALWYNEADRILAAYEGRTVEEITDLEVAKKADGSPLVKEDGGFSDFGSEFLATDATMSSARLMLAVQNALSKVNG